MSDQPPSKVKAGIVWVLMRLWPRWKRLAEMLDRFVLWIWPGFKDR